MTENDEFVISLRQCEKKIADFAQKVAECAKKSAVADEKAAAALKVDECGFLLAQASLYIVVSNLRQAEKGQANDSALGDARKCVAAALSLLADVVSDDIDAPFSETAEKSRSLEGIGLKARLGLMRKIGVLLDLLSHEYKENAKQKWSMVDLWARFAAVAKNFVDVKEVIKVSFDLNEEGCEDCRQYLAAVGLALRKSIDWHSQRFDFSSRSVDDLRKASVYADVYSRLLAASGAGAESQKMQKLSKYYDEKCKANLRMQKKDKEVSG